MKERRLILDMFGRLVVYILVVLYIWYKYFDKKFLKVFKKFLKNIRKWFIFLVDIGNIYV